MKALHDPVGRASPSRRDDEAVHRLVRLSGTLRPTFLRFMVRVLGWEAVWASIVLLLFTRTLMGQPGPKAPAASTNIVVLETEGVVEVRRFGAERWDPIKPNAPLDPGDQLQTGPRSRATVRWTDLTVKRLDEFTLLQVPREPTKRTGFSLLRGVLYFLHRDRPGEFDVQTPTVSAVVRGTEFNLSVATNGTTTFTVFDGSVELTNAFGPFVLESGEQAVVEPGKAPVKTAMLASQRNDVIQWSLFYPGVLDPDELPLAADESIVLRDSLSHYRSGDLLQALKSYPENRKPGSEAESVYLAALVLAVGRVDETEKWLNEIKGLQELNRLNELDKEGAAEHRAAFLAEALRKVIAAVKLQPEISNSQPSTLNSQLSSALLAESYWQQSQAKLDAALKAARAATEKSPQFGFAWARLAEIEFSFGRIGQARAALEKGLSLSPRNAQAIALKGFLLSAQNRFADARAQFENAIEIDGALGNAWLGRGLIRIRQGDAAGGRKDLQVAAVLEPQRALLRSYLGKAFHEIQDAARAAKELDLAKQSDPKDPTAWLYSALFNRQENRINSAVSDLERSQDLNDNRNVYRSRLLLDQDRAVRSANLASIYRDAGMREVSVREASRAVESDFGNYSAHLFLANSYAELRDPRQVNLRYETPWFNELLLANLLSPVAGGSLSQNISLQEYARLFERDRLGVSSFTEYSSRGDWLEAGSQFGAFGNAGYSIDAVHLTQNGQRPNEDVDQLTLFGKIKQQLSPQDTLFLQTWWYENKSGDVRQYYDPSEAHLRLRFTEKQEPTLLVGYHREWTPGSHTLFLAGRLDDRVTANDPDARILVQARDADGSIRRVRDFDFAQNYRSQLEAYSAELQHIWSTASQTLIVGSRYQGGQVDTISEIGRDPTYFPANLLTNAVVQGVTTELERFSVYAYEHWKVADPLQVSVGLSYDRLRFPGNIDNPPILDSEEIKDQVSPKAGFVWTLNKDTTFRGAYTRSLGGIYYDASVRLEPSQLGGFLQAFRSAIPESVVGPVPGSEFETGGLSLDHKFRSGTYVGLSGEILRSDADRMIGVFDLPGQNGIPASAPESLGFEERTLTVTLNQLLGDGWAAGVVYRLSEADLDTNFRELPTTAFASSHTRVEATLHQLVLFALLNHSSGFFARVESMWNAQSNRGYVGNLPGDDFWQFNGFIGYRFPHRRAEARVGLLNITDQDYRLNPLNLHAELPRERTLTVSLKFEF